MFSNVKLRKNMFFNVHNFILFFAIIRFCEFKRISTHFLELLGIGATFVGICVSTVRPKKKKKTSICGL